MVKNIRIKIQKSILILIKMYYFKHNFIDILLIAIIIWSIETSNSIVFNNLNKYYSLCGWIGVGLILIFNVFLTFLNKFIFTLNQFILNYLVIVEYLLILKRFVDLLVKLADIFYY